MQQCTGFSSWALTCMSCSFNIFICCTHLIPGVETPTFGSRNECPHLLSLFHQGFYQHLSPEHLVCRPERKGDTMITQIGGERVSAPSQPRVAKELLEELRSLLPSKSAAGVVFPGPLCGLWASQSGSHTLLISPWPLPPQHERLSERAPTGHLPGVRWMNGYIWRQPGTMTRKCRWAEGFINFVAIGSSSLPDQICSMQ